MKTHSCADYNSDRPDLLPTNRDVFYSGEAGLLASPKVSPAPGTPL